MGARALRSEKWGEPGAQPLLMLHGWGRSLESLRPLGQTLGRASHVHLLDLPGFGGSAFPEEAWGCADYAKRIICYLDEQQIQRADLLGHSFGGKLSLYLAHHYPTRVRRLILIGAAGLRPRHTLSQTLYFRGVKYLGQLVKMLDESLGSKLYETRFIPSFGSRDYLQAGDMRPTLVKTLSEDLTDLIPRINTPALLLWGDKDSETPVEMGERMERWLPRARLLTLAGKGHEPFAGMGAHLCAYHILSYLLEENV